MRQIIRMTNEEKSRGLFRGISSFVLRLPRRIDAKVGHPFGIRLPRRSHAKVGHSLFVVFTRVVLILAVTVAVSCSSKRITKANVDQVTEGMSKKQVESILGPPTARMTDVYVYRQGKDTVAIVFKDDKVQSKKSTLSD